MLPQEEIRQIFAEHKAIITGDHFVYAKKADGWYHSSDYVSKEAIYPYSNALSILCKQIAERFKKFGVEVVVGPTVGAVKLASWTGHWLGVMASWEVLDVFADEEDVLEHRCCEPGVGGYMGNIIAAGKVTLTYGGDEKLRRIDWSQKVDTRRVLKRGYDAVVKDMKCLVVEDVLNIGITAAKTCGVVTQCGGVVVGVGALCNRSGGKVTAETLGVPVLFSLLDVSMEMFKEDEQGFCQICREKGRGSVRTDLGKGAEFLARWGLKPGDK